MCSFRSALNPFWYCSYTSPLPPPGFFAVRLDHSGVPLLKSTNRRNIRTFQFSRQTTRCRGSCVGTESLSLQHQRMTLGYHSTRVPLQRACREAAANSISPLSGHCRPCHPFCPHARPPQVGGGWEGGGGGMRGREQMLWQED